MFLRKTLYQIFFLIFKMIYFVVIASRSNKIIIIRNESVIISQLFFRKYYQAESLGRNELLKKSYRIENHKSFDKFDKYMVIVHT